MFGERDMASIERSFNFFGEAMKDFTILILISEMVEMEEKTLYMMLEDKPYLQDLVSQFKDKCHAFNLFRAREEDIKPVFENMKKKLMEKNISKMRRPKRLIRSFEKPLPNWKNKKRQI